MPNPKILDYIYAQMKQGVTKDTILTNLKAGGWPEADVSAAFAAAERDFNHIKDSESFTPKIRKHYGKMILKILGVIVALAAIAFACFSILYNAGIVDTSGLDFLKNLPEETSDISGSDSSKTLPLVNKPIISSNQTFSESGGVTADEKNEIAAAILTLKSIFATKNPSGIRNYLVAGLSSSDSVRFSSMSDSQILDYATLTLPTFAYITGDYFFAATTVWKKDNDTTVEVNFTTPAGVVLKVAHKVGDTWY